MDSSQSKNLPASQRKLQKARDEGQVVRSRDLSNLIVLGTGALATLMLAPQVLERFKLALAQQFSFNAQTVIQSKDLTQRLQDISVLGLGVAATFAAIILPAVIIGTIATGGWVFSLTPILPDFSRISPLTGLGRLFSKEQFTNVLKLLLLSTVLVTVATFYFMSNLHTVVALGLTPAASAVPELARWITAGVSSMLLVVAAIAVLDLPLQTMLFKSRMKMSYEEVKQEQKDSEGNMQMKGKMRQRQRDMAQRNSVSAVPKADFVVMNPTHYAVALKYDEERMAAPQVISKGSDLLALRIRDLAKAHQIPVLQSPMLARALYAHAELNQEIPAKLYTAVAQVLAYVYRVKAALAGLGPMPDEAPQPHVPPELDPLGNPSTTVTEP